MSAYPSGEQWTISHGDQEAIVVEVGGGLRTLPGRRRSTSWPATASTSRPPPAGASC